MYIIEQCSTRIGNIGSMDFSIGQFPNNQLSTVPKASSPASAFVEEVDHCLKSI